MLEHVLKVLNMGLLNVSSRLQMIAKHCCTGAPHYTQLLRQIGEVFHLRRGPLSALRHASGAAPAHRSAKDVPKHLAEDIAARHLRRVGIRGHGMLLSARYLHPTRPTFDYHRLETALLYAFLQLFQNCAEEIAITLPALI